MEQCIVCNKPTTNPKFCSRSCSATYTNKHSPKRKLEGTCDTCGIRIRASRKKCEDCRNNLKAKANAMADQREKTIEQEKIDKVPREQHVRSWQTLSGEQREAPIGRTYDDSVHMFSFRQRSGNALRLSDPIDRLLDYALAICFDRPAYLTPMDARRHVVLIDELRIFECANYGRPQIGKTLQAGMRPIEDLDSVLGKWVDTYLRDARSILLASYAVDTARFIQKHAFGHRGSEPASWRVNGILSEDALSRHDRFPDSRLKKDISEHLGRVRVIVTVPAGASFVHRYSEAKLLEGASFLFEIERCHLSISWYDNGQGIFSAVDPSVRFDISSEFCFRGTPFLFSDGGSGLYAPSLVDFSDPSRPELGDLWRGWETYHAFAQLPARWITHTVSNEGAIAAVPNWIAEIS